MQKPKCHVWTEHIWTQLRNYGCSPTALLEIKSNSDLQENIVDTFAQFKKYIKSEAGVLDGRVKI